jgi:hypothetical protein
MMTALGLWTAGFALAGASTWHLHRAAVVHGDTNEPSSCAAPSEEPADTAEPEGVVFMPTDMIVGRTTPRTGVTMVQKP